MPINNNTIYVIHIHERDKMNNRNWDRFQHSYVPNILCEVLFIVIVILAHCLNSTGSVSWDYMYYLIIMQH